MTDSNPYQSPQAAPLTDEIDGFDVGKFVGRYLQALAGLSCGTMIVGTIIQGRFFFDFSFIFYYWAGAALVHHSRIARQIVIWISAAMTVGAACMLVMAFLPNVQNFSITIFDHKLQNPSLAIVLASGGLLFILSAVPLVILNTPKARREFKKPRDVTWLSREAK